MGVLNVMIKVSFDDMAYDRKIYKQEDGGSPGEQNKHLLWRISLVDIVHRIVSDMTDEKPPGAWSTAACFRI